MQYTFGQILEVTIRRAKLRNRSGALLVLCVLALGPTDTVDAQMEGVPAPPAMPTFDVEALDLSADPCEDFYQYSCGGWHAKNPIPVDESFWSRVWTQFWNQLDGYLRALIEEAAESEADQTSDAQKVGDHFAACMDTTTIEARGLAPLRPELALVDGMTSIEDLPTALGTLIRQTGPSGWEALLIGLTTAGDPVDGGQAKRLWVHSQDVLGLPARDDYLDEDSSSVGLRAAYNGHIATMLQLVGEPEARATRQAEAILALEAALAEAQVPASVLRNDADARVGLRTPEALQLLTPRFDWTAFFGALGVPEVELLNVVESTYLAELDSLLAEVPLTTWQAFLRFHIVSNRASLLPKAFRDASFDFNGRTLRGREMPRPRWQTCVWQVEGRLPDALSRLFVERAFRPEMGTETLGLFEEIKDVMRSRIELADWMAPETKRQAFEKLDSVRISVGHPDTWLDDRRVVIRRDDFYGNSLRAGAALRRTDLEGLDRPLDLNEWARPPTSVIGYQANEHNAIVIAAGYLLYLDDPTNDLAVRYGVLGTLLAHELLHGFDPLGRKYDAEGRLRDWWTEDDATRFDARAECVAEQFSQYEYAPGIPIDGAYVVSEQVAELSAVSIAWEAYQNAETGELPKEVGGTMAAQRFFLANSQHWCSAATEEAWRAMASGDSHVWGSAAVNGTVLNLPEFGEAFGCRVGQAMVSPPQKTCKVW